MPTVYESGMPEEELRNILSVSLIEDVNETALARCSGQQSATKSSTESDADIENTEDDSDEEEIQMLRREHANSTEGSTRQRQIKALLDKLESDRKVQKRFSRTMRDGRLAHHLRMLVELGVVEQSRASQLITDPDEPLPTDLE